MMTEPQKHHNDNRTTTLSQWYQIQKLSIW